MIVYCYLMVDSNEIFWVPREKWLRRCIAIWWSWRWLIQVRFLRFGTLGNWEVLISIPRGSRGLNPIPQGIIPNLGSSTVNILWSLNCWARGAMMVYCNLMVTTMVDSNEMFVNEAIHQGTDMRHPMCPNAIFSREKKPRPKSSAAVLEALQNTEVCVIAKNIFHDFDGYCNQWNKRCSAFVPALGQIGSQG